MIAYATLPDVATIAKQLGGEVSGGEIVCPGPHHSAADRRLSVKIDSTSPDGFVVHSFAGDDTIGCRDHVRAKLGLPPFEPTGCVLCHTDGGAVFRIKDGTTVGGKSEPLHEHCAPRFFAPAGTDPSGTVKR